MTIVLVPWKGSAMAKLVEDSGLSPARFARLVLANRGPRTIRRWKKDGVPSDVEEWAREDVVRLERRGHLVSLTVRAPLNARDDRRSPTQRDDEEDEG